MRFFKLLLLLLVAGSLVACAGRGNDDRYSEGELYQHAQRFLDKGKYYLAIGKLRSLESRYPFGRYAEQAQLELIYANYKYRDFDAAEAAAERYIRLHPQHEHIDYAYYMRAVSAYERGRSFMMRYLPIDNTQRDPAVIRNAYHEFARLVNRFPDSKYTPDARQRMMYLRNVLADHELHVAQYYMKRKAYVAALNRGSYIVENFQGSPAVADGLAIMVQNYRLLGMDELAADSLQLLQDNYPWHPSVASGHFVAQYHVHDRTTTDVSKVYADDLSVVPQTAQARKAMQRHYLDAMENIPKEVRESR